MHTSLYATIVICVFQWKLQIRSRNCDCLVTRLCYQLIAKPGNKTAAVSWPDPYIQHMTLRLIKEAILIFEFKLLSNLSKGYVYCNGNVWYEGVLRLQASYSILAQFPRIAHLHHDSLACWVNVFKFRHLIELTNNYFQRLLTKISFTLV